MKREFKRHLNKRESWAVVMLLSLFCALVFGIWMSSGAWLRDNDGLDISVKLGTIEIEDNTNESLKETIYVAQRNQQILSEDVTFSISPKSSELYARIGVFVTTANSTSQVAKDVIKFQNFVPTENEGYMWVRDGEWYYFCDQNGKPVPLSHRDSGKAFGFMTTDSFVMPNDLRPQHYASNDTVELEIRVESVQARNVESDSVTKLAPYFSTAYPDDNYVVTFKDLNGTTLKTQTVKYAGDVTQPTAPSITGKIFESWNTLKDGTGADVFGEEFNNISQDLTLYPRYRGDEVTVTVIQTANGEITPGTTTTIYGDTLNFEVKANGGYKISSILIGGQNVEIKDENEQIVAVENIVGDTTLTATYELKDYLISVMSTGEGVTTPNSNQNVKFGDDISFTFAANEGKYISSLKIDGIEQISGVSTKNYEYTFTSVSQDHSVDVVYETSIFKITTQVVAHSDGYNYGEISPTENTCAFGKSVNFTVSAFSGAKIVSIKVNGSEKMIGNNLSKTNINVAPTSDTLIEVTFQPLWKMTKIDSKFYITEYMGNDANLVVPASIYDAESGTDVNIYGVRSLNYSPTTLVVSNGIEYIGGNGSLNIFSTEEMNISSITLPNSITIIDSYAFKGCSEIKNFVVPSKLQKIGDYAFQNCSNILAYDMPKTLLQIGVGAFDGNIGMSQLTFNSIAAPTIADGNIFSGTTSSLKVRVPASGKASYVNNLSNRSFAENTYMYGLTGTTPIAIYKDNIFRYIYYIDIINGTGGSSEPETGRIEVYQTQKFEVTFTPNAGNRIEAIYVDSSDENLLTAAEGDSQTYVFDNIQNSHMIEAVYSKMYIRLDINGGDGNQPLVAYNEDKTQFRINDNIEPTKSGKEFYYYSTNPSDNEQGQNGDRYDLGLWYDLPSLTSSTTLYAIYLTPTSYTTTSQYVVVPKTVSAITGSSLKNMFGTASDSTLKYITLHRNTTTIGSYALYYCKTLTGISQSDGVLAVGNCAFYECAALTKYRVATATTSLGEEAFAYCTSLKDVQNFENTNVSTISICVLRGTTALKQITVPNSISIIQDKAFAESGLTSIDLSKTNTTEIGASAFADCSNLADISLPTMLQSIGGSAFDSCSNLRSVTNLAKTIVSKIDAFAFELCTNLLNIKLPQTLEILGEAAFYQCTNLSTVSGLENTQITVLEPKIFYECTSLTTLSLPRTLTKISDGVAEGCTVLKRVDNLSSTKVTSIGKRAFSETQALTSISVPTTLTTLDEYCFADSGLEKINNLKNCTKLTTIEYGCFRNSGLKEIEFPDIKDFKIKDYAFNNCTDLEKVTFNNATPPTIAETSFEGTTNKVKVYIPNGTIDAYAPMGLGGLHFKGFSSGDDAAFSNYTAIDYLESTGTQYIDTGYIPNEKTKFDITFAANSANAGIDCPLFGVRASDYSNSYLFWCHAEGFSGGASQIIFNGTKSNVGYFTVDKKYNIVIQNGSYSINGTTSSFTSVSAGTPNKNLILFGLSNGGNIDGRKFAGRLYAFKIWDNGTLVRDYIPAIRNSDGVAGLYDKVEGKFYTNSGTGSFATGATNSSVVEDYQRIESLKFTGKEYINTGVIPTANTKVETTFNTSTVSRWLFGSRTSASSSDIYGVFLSSATGLWYQIRSSQSTKTVDNYFNMVSTLSTNRSSFTLNGKTTSGFGSTALSTSQWQMYIGSINTSGSADSGQGRHFIGDIYSFKIWEGDTLIRDFVPVVRSSDGVAGLWDKVESKFYKNSGSGAFDTGDVITPEKALSNGATMHYIGNSITIATCIDNVFKRHCDITMNDATYYFDSEQTRTIEINETLPAGASVKYTWITNGGQSGSGNSFTNIGTYHVTATILGEFYAPTTATATLTILQASLSGITFTDKTFVYDGTKKSIEISVSGKSLEERGVPDPSYTIVGVNKESVDSAATNGTTQVGVYEVTATFGGALAGNSLKAYLTITKATKNISLTDKTVVFDGEDHTLDQPSLPNGMSISSSTALGKEYDKNHNLTVSVSATVNGALVTRSNSGSYTITVNFAGGRNYNDTSSSATLSITPSSRSISFDSSIAKGWVYDGTEHTISATLNSASGSASITYSYTGTLSGNGNTFRDAGTYNLTAVLKDNPNYYNSSASVTFTIRKADLSTTLNTYSQPFTGNPHTYVLTNGVVGKGTDGTFSASNCNIVYSYTGKEFTADDTSSPNGGSVSVNGNTATNAGWYSTTLVITAPLSSNGIQNYNVLTIKGTNNFKITKAPSSFDVVEVWALSGTSFKNPLKFESTTSQTITYSSSDTEKVSVQSNNGVISFLVTSIVNDRTSSTAASKVTITATGKNVATKTFVINLIPFRYASHSNGYSYTSSKPNNGDVVLFPATLTPNKIVDGVVTGERETLTVKVMSAWALSSSYEYGAVEIEEGITTLYQYALQGSKITKLTLPSTLTSINYAAIQQSTVEEIIFNSDFTMENATVISSLSKLKKVTCFVALSTSISFSNINAKAWGFSSSQITNGDYSKLTIVNNIQTKGYYYAMSENAVSVEADSKTTWFSTLTSACNYAKGKTATVTVWKAITISSSIVLNTSGTNITLKSADYGCTVTRDAANFFFFQVGSGSTLKITSNIVLDGAKDQYTTNTHSVIYVGAGTFTMSGGTIQNNRATNGGAIVIEEGNKTFTMSDGTIQNCIATHSAGAIFMYASSAFTMEGGTISKCEAENLDGGAVYVSADAEVHLNDGIINECKAKNSGGGLFITETAKAYLSGGTIKACSATSKFGGAVYNNGEFTMNNVNSGIVPSSSSLLATKNRAPFGGAIYNAKSGKSYLSAGTIKGFTTFSNDGAYYAGGGIYNAGTVTISGSITISGNAYGNGGGIFNASGRITMSGGTITSSSASGNNGGGVYVAGGTFEMRGGAIVDNCLADNGGGVYVAGGALYLKGGTIDGCSADYGGGLAITGSAIFEMNSGAISNNTASENGGGIWCDTAGWTGDAANAKITGGTIGGVGVDEDGEKIGGNTAKNGGGVFVTSDNKISIWGGAISNNSATDGGGVYVCEWGELYLSHESATSSHPTITSNQADNNGGGLYWAGYGKLYAWNKTEISNNSATCGGGIYTHLANDSRGAKLASAGGRKDVILAWQLNNIVVNGNTAEQGGGLYADDSCRQILNNVEMRYNSATRSQTDGSLFFCRDSRINLTGTTNMSGDIRIVNVGAWETFEMNEATMWCLSNNGWSGNNGLKIQISQDAYKTKLGNQTFRFYLFVGDTTIARSIIEPYYSGLEDITWNSNSGELWSTIRN